MSAQLYELAATGSVTPQLVAELREVAIVKTTMNSAPSVTHRFNFFWMVSALLLSRLPWH